MSNRTLFIALFICLGNLTPGVLFAEQANIYRLGVKSPIIDGQPETLWEQTLWLDIGNSRDESTSPWGLPIAQYKVLFDDNALFYLVRITAEPDKSRNEHEIAVELLFKPGYKNAILPYQRFRFSLHPEPAGEEGNSAAAGVMHAWSAGPEGHMLEVQIPFDCLAAVEPATLPGLQYNVVVIYPGNAGSPDTVLAWSTCRPEHPATVMPEEAGVPTALPAHPIRAGAGAQPEAVMTGWGDGIFVTQKAYINLEAEDAAYPDDGFKIRRFYFTKNKYLVTEKRNQGTVIFTAGRLEPGLYSAWLKVYGWNRNANEFYFSPGRETCMNEACRVEFLPAADFIWVRAPGNFLIDSAGTYTFTFSGREPNVKLDRIALTNDDTFQLAPQVRPVAAYPPHKQKAYTELATILRQGYALSKETLARYADVLGKECMRKAILENAYRKLSDTITLGKGRDRELILKDIRVINRDYKFIEIFKEDGVYQLLAGLHSLVIVIYRNKENERMFYATELTGSGGEITFGDFITKVLPALFGLGFSGEKYKLNEYAGEFKIKNNFTENLPENKQHPLMDFTAFFQRVRSDTTPVTLYYEPLMTALQCDLFLVKQAMEKRKHEWHNIRPVYHALYNTCGINSNTYAHDIIFTSVGPDCWKNTPTGWGQYFSKYRPYNSRYDYDWDKFFEHFEQ